VGDLIWAAADAQAKGFLIGATAGRTTLLGEGLQHQDGHSLLLASSVPTCQAYDPAFAYEMATIIAEGLRRMYGGRPPEGVEGDDLGENVFYYLTLYNENYVMPARPDGLTDEDITSGLYRWARAPEGGQHPATILFSGSGQGAARQAQADLAEHYGVGAELWSATSYKRLREEGLSTERWNRLHPGEQPRRSPVTEKLGRSAGPIVTVSDYMKAVSDQIARFVPIDGQGRPRSFTSLGTDGFGRSDERRALRRFFEIDAGHVVAATLAALCAEGEIEPAAVKDALSRYDLDPDSADPRTR
jgi:pyruvate dehydrogenase E1 component